MEQMIDEVILALASGLWVINVGVRLRLLA